MNNNPKVSVLLTSYNHAKFLRESIDSVLNQTYTDYELIIWDDSSTDDSWEIICSYSSPKIKSFLEKKNTLGSYVNKAVSETVRGEYVAIHHSDDIWKPDKLEKQVSFLDENPIYCAVFTLVQVIDDEGNDYTDSNHPYTNIFNRENRTRFEWLNRFFYQGNCLCHPSVLIRKECYKKKLYDERYRQLSDFDYWVKLCFENEIYIIQEKLIKFRIHANELNMSGTRPTTLMRHHLELFMILKNYLEIGSLKELLKIFPEINNEYKDLDNSLIDFYIAQLALKVNSQAHQLFGLNILFDFMKDEDKANLVGIKYNFHYKDLINLTGKFNVFNLPIISARLYIDTGLGFNEKQTITQEIIGNEKYMEFDLSSYSDIKYLRFDPSNKPSVIKLIAVMIISKEGEAQKLTNYNANIIPSNDNILMFGSSEPHIYFIEPLIRNPQKLAIELEYMAIGNAAYDYFNKIIDSIYSSYTHKIGKIITLAFSLQFGIISKIIIESVRFRWKKIKTNVQIINITGRQNKLTPKTK